MNHFCNKYCDKGELLKKCYNRQHAREGIQVDYAALNSVEKQFPCPRDRVEEREEEKEEEEDIVFPVRRKRSIWLPCIDQFEKDIQDHIYALLSDEQFDDVQAILERYSDMCTEEIEEKKHIHDLRTRHLKSTQNTYKEFMVKHENSQYNGNQYYHEVLEAIVNIIGHGVEYMNSKHVESVDKLKHKLDALMRCQTVVSDMKFARSIKKQRN